MARELRARNRRADALLAKGSGSLIADAYRYDLPLAGLGDKVRALEASGSGSSSSNSSNSNSNRENAAMRAEIKAWAA